MPNATPQAVPSLATTFGTLGMLADHGFRIVGKNGTSPALDALLSDAEFKPQHPMLQLLRTELTAGEPLVRALQRAIPSERFIQGLIHHAEAAGVLADGLMLLGRLPTLEAAAQSELEFACTLSAAFIDLGFPVDTAVDLAAMKISGQLLRPALRQLADGIRKGTPLADSVRGTSLAPDALAQHFLEAVFSTGEPARSFQGLAEIERARAKNTPPLRLFALTLGLAIDAGVPVRTALEVAIPAADPALQVVIRDVIDDVQKGATLDESMARKQQPTSGGDGFAATFVAAIAAGVQSGGLETALLRYGRMS